LDELDETASIDSRVAESRRREHAISYRRWLRIKKYEPRFGIEMLANKKEEQGLGRNHLRGDKRSYLCQSITSGSPKCSNRTKIERLRLFHYY